MTKTPPLWFDGRHINTGVAKGLIVGSHFTHVSKIASAKESARTEDKQKTNKRSYRRERERDTDCMEIEINKLQLDLFRDILTKLGLGSKMIQRS